MKYFSHVIVLLLSFCSVLNAQSPESFHSFEVRTIQGDTISLSQFAGKKIMVVNTASYCAYTYQYGQLESLYQQYADQNFTILGFPCNDFGNQEPGTDSSVAEFCSNTYNVQFPMMSIIHIRTGDTAAVYKWLQRGDLNGVSDAIVSWNFNKFLIDEDGNWVRHFPSTVLPSDTAIVNWILSDSGEVTGTKNTDALAVSKIISQNGAIQLELDAPKGDEMLFEIIGLDGKVNYTSNQFVLKGQNSITLPTQNLANGIFCLRISSDTNFVALKFTVWQ